MQNTPFSFFFFVCNWWKGWNNDCRATMFFFHTLRPVVCSNAQFILKLALRRRLGREFLRRDHIEAYAGTGHLSGYKGKICVHASRRRASYFLFVILSLCSSASAPTRVLEIFSVKCSHYRYAVAKLMDYVRQLMALRHFGFLKISTHNFLYINSSSAVRLF